MYEQDEYMKLLKEFYLTVLIPLVYVANLWLVMQPSTHLSVPIYLKLSGVIVGFIGIGLWILSYVSLGRSFGVLPKTQKMVSNGVYRFVKHPMYSGIMMTFSGLSLANNSLYGLVFTGVITLPMLVIRALLEEKLLRIPA